MVSAFNQYQKLANALASVRRWATRWRTHITIVAGLVFVVGLIVSAHALELSREQISVLPILLNVLILTPTGLALAALSLGISARAVGCRIGFREAFSVSAIGQVSEILPIPGNALVRGAALMRAGAGLRDSAWITMLVGLLTVLLAAAFSSVAIVLYGYALGWVGLVATSAGVLVCVVWIAHRTALKLAMSVIALRVLALALTMLRIAAAFATIGVSVDFLEAALFVVSPTLSMAATIVPAGLGVAEITAAALAYFVQITAAAAFTAMAVNRIIGLAVSGAVAFVLISILRPSMASQSGGSQ